MLTHIEKPFKAKQFGGDPASLQYVTSYLKSMSELARNTEALKKKEVEKGRRRLHQPVPERSCQGQQKGNSARRRRTSRPQMPEPSESMHGRRKLKELPNASDSTES